MATPDGFAEYVTARQAALLRTAYLLTGHAQDAEDLVQTTLVKVVPQWRRIRDDPEAYVRRVMSTRTSPGGGAGAGASRARTPCPSGSRTGRTGPS